MRDGRGLVDILLDKKDRNPALIDLTNDIEVVFDQAGGGSSEGSSIKSSFGARMRPRPIETMAWPHHYYYT